MLSEEHPEENENERELRSNEVISRCRPVSLRGSMRVVTLIQDRDGNRAIIADVVYTSKD